MSSIERLKNERRIDDSANKLNDDAIAILAALAWRLVKGQAEHGHLDLSSEARDWNDEKRDELLDAMVYSEFARQKAATAVPPPVPELWHVVDNASPADERYRTVAGCSRTWGPWKHAASWTKLVAERVAKAWVEHGLPHVAIERSNAFIESESPHEAENKHYDAQVEALRSSVAPLRAMLDEERKARASERRWLRRRLKDAVADRDDCTHQLALEADAHLATSKRADAAEAEVALLRADLATLEAEVVRLTARVHLEEKKARIHVEFGKDSASALVAEKAKNVELRKELAKRDAERSGRPLMNERVEEKDTRDASDFGVSL